MPRHRQGIQKRPGTLLICEGRECEPNYFDALARDRGLTNLIIPRNDVSDPMNLVGRAADGLKRDQFVTQAFAVFDTYEHQNYQGAIERASRIDAEERSLAAYPSYPSFEYWLLLHFEMTRAPMDRDEAYHRLKAHLPKYQKGSAEIMDEIILRLDVALERAERVWNDVEDTGELNSSTTVHKLITRLLS